MTLTDVFGIIRRQWFVLLICLVVGGGAGAAYALAQPKTYVASSRLYVTMSNGSSVNDSYQGGMAAQQRIASYASLATGTEVAQRVHDRLGLTVSPDVVQKSITASFPPATSLLDVSVTDTNPDGARLGANAVASVLVDMVAEIETIENGAPPAARLRVVEEARTPGAPSGPVVTRIVALGLAVGLVVGWLAAFVRDRLRRPKVRVESPEPLTSRQAARHRNSKPASSDPAESTTSDHDADEDAQPATEEFQHAEGRTNGRLESTT